MQKMSEVIQLLSHRILYEIGKQTYHLLSGSQKVGRVADKCYCLQILFRLTFENQFKDMENSTFHRNKTIFLPSFSFSLSISNLGDEVFLVDSKAPQIPIKKIVTLDKG